MTKTADDSSIWVCLRLNLLARKAMEGTMNTYYAQSCSRAEVIWEMSDKGISIENDYCSWRVCGVEFVCGG